MAHSHTQTAALLTLTHAFISITLRPCQQEVPEIMSSKAQSAQTKTAGEKVMQFSNSF